MGTRTVRAVLALVIVSGLAPWVGVTASTAATTRDCDDQDPLGIAGRFTEFIHHDAQRISDSEGMVAYGGDAALGDAAAGVGFSVGSGQPVDSVGPDLPTDPRVHRLIVGGEVHAYRVVVHGGSARVGSQASGSQPIDAAGPVTEGPPTLSADSTTPLDFDHEFAELTARSNRWGELATNGVISTSSRYSVLTLEGVQARLNVFDLTKAQFEGAHAIRIKVPAGSGILVNVAGTDLSTHRAPLSTISIWDPVTEGYVVDDHFINGHPVPSEDWLRLRQSLLWNFPEATHLLKNEVSWPGTILAPGAAFEFGRGETIGPGHIDGHLIAASVTSAVGAETHYMPLIDPCLPSIDLGLGSLRVTKQLSGPVARAAETFHVHVDCMGTAYDRTVALTVPSGESEASQVIPGLPTGLVCTLSEPSVPAGWTLDDIAPRTIVVRRDATAAATVTNRRRLGSLVIRKRIEGDATDAPRTFTLHLGCDDAAFDQDVELHVPVGSTSAETTVNGLPLGTTCSVTEPDVDPVWQRVSIAPTSVTISSETTAAVVTATNRRRLGSLTIAKQIRGDTPPTTARFDFAVDCTGVRYDQSATVSVPGAPVTIPNLPLGLVCHVSETDLPPGWTADDPAPRTVVVDDDPDVDAAFTNSYATGSIVLTKTTTNPPVADTDFTMRLDCDGTAFDQDDVVTVPAGATSGRTTVGDLPVGLRCAASEVDLPAGWGEVSLSPQEVTVASGAPVQVDAVNDQGTAGLRVVKHLVGDPIDAPSRFTFVDECDDGEDFTQVLSVPAGSTTASGVIGGLAPGTRCTVTEQDPGPDWDPGSTGPQTVTIGQPDAPPVAADFINTREVGSLTLTKSTVGDPIAGAETFDLDVDCDGSDYDRIVPLTVDSTRATASATLDDLPVGLACTVSEPDVPTGWALEGIGPQRAVVGTDPSVTVTNALVTGTLRLTKQTVDADGAPLPVDETTTFTLDVDCDGSAFDREVALTMAAGADSVSRDLTGIPGGAWCEVTEAPLHGWAQEGVTPAHVQVAPDQVTTVTATNARRTGTLVLGKRVVGETAPVDTMFRLHLACTDSALDQTVPVTVPAESRAALATVPGVPFGTTCHLTEPDQPNAEWQPLPSVPERVTMGRVAGVAVLLARDSRPTGSLEVVKRLATGAVAHGTSFRFHADCPGTAYDADLVLTVPRHQVRQLGRYTGLPTSQACAITEQPTSGWRLSSSTNNAHTRPGGAPAVFVNAAIPTPPPACRCGREGPHRLLPDTGMSVLACWLLLVSVVGIALGIALLRRRPD